MNHGKRRSVALLFLGGTLLDERDRAGDSIRRKSDIDRWMAQMGEMDMIAETTGVYIGSGGPATSLQDWIEAGRAIGALDAKHDGFVVFHYVPTIPSASVALSLMLKKMNKPVVLVGSLFLNRQERTAGLANRWHRAADAYGARASFINALQVAVSDVAEVVAVFGNTILRGATVAGDAETGTLRGEVLGKIDFGVRLYGQQVRRANRAVQVRDKFDTKVVVADIAPGFNQAALLAAATAAHGLFLSAPDGGVSSALITAVHRRVAPNVPIVIFAPVTDSAALPKNVIPLWGMSRSTALLRLMWAIGQTPALARRKTLILSD